MSIIREFNKISEFMKYLDDELAENRKILGEMLKKLEELRVRAEQEKKVKSVLGKLGLPEPSIRNEIALKNVRIIINPLPTQELSSLESSIESLNNRITQLMNIRKELEILGNIDVETKITVVYVDGLPKIVLLKFT